MRARPVAVTLWNRITSVAPSFRVRRQNQRLGLLVNIGTRLSIAYFLAEVLRFPDDPRFAGKAIPVRNLIIVGSLSLLFPTLHLWQRRWEHYPYWLDSLYLSIFGLDMAGNSFDLYDSYYYFDLIPHAHGSGALAVTLQEMLAISPLGAVGLANIIHILLEAQEYYTDVLFGTRNVRGVSDTINDLLAGVVGTSAYMAIYVLSAQSRQHQADEATSKALVVR